MEYTSDNGENVFLTSCVVAFNLPSLYFLIGSYWYEVYSEDYIQLLDDKCFVCLLKGTD